MIVVKFGGTSVADGGGNPVDRRDRARADCRAEPVVVVSALSGVTNGLLPSRIRPRPGS